LTAWRSRCREFRQNRQGLRLRAILIVLLLVNVVWAVLSASQRGDGHTNSVGSSPATPRKVGSGLALLSELPPPVAKVAGERTAEASSERDGALVPSEQASLVADISTEVSTSSPQTCVAVGPFDQFDEVEALRDEILAQGGNAEVVEEEIAAQPDYLVYIATTGSRVVARRLREELKAQAIDSHIIAGGELQDALSVGVFSRERHARAQYERVSALGYEAKLRDLPRRQTVYHLMTDRVAAAPDAPRRAACHEIASAHHFL
jgi:hypothetical protein